MRLRCVGGIRGRTGEGARGSDANALLSPRAAGHHRTGPIIGDSDTPLEGVDILLVDHHEATLILFRDALEAAGAEVRAVSTATDALREHDKRRPDLLVTDLGLPGIDGLELLHAIRTKSPKMPAVAVAGYARLGDRARALGAGFQAHVSKPIDPAAFVRALAAAVSPTD